MHAFITCMEIKMKLSWKKANRGKYIGSNGASRTYEIDLVVDGRTAKGAANAKQDGRHLSAVGACSSSMPGAVTHVVASLKRMCKAFEDEGAEECQSST